MVNRFDSGEIRLKNRAKKRKGRAKMALPLVS